MKVGLIPAVEGAVATSGEQIRLLAAAVESSGFDSIWVGEHVVLPVTPRVAYPGEHGGLKGPSAGSLPDPLEWLTFVAAVSDQLLLGTAIMIAPLHNPLILAKRVATLDQLSGGRLRLGVGVGWNEQEFESVGVPFEGRGRRCEEVISAMRALWRESPASFDGKYFGFEPVYSSPRPIDSAVPVLVGGNSVAAAKRAGRLGDGYLPFEPDVDRLGELIQLMRGAAVEAGRDPDTIEITSVGSVRRERAARLAGLGVHRMLLFMSGAGSASLAEFGERCQAAVRGL